jgi:hypothetical protein
MILVPISIGELIDKITILKIKQLKINDKDKLQNVLTEYNLLIQIMNKYGIYETDEYFLKLYNINLEFWEYHDWQREEWRKYDENTINIQLYQKTKNEHILNDKRAEIKKQINIVFDSNIIEEKQFISYHI